MLTQAMELEPVVKGMVDIYTGDPNNLPTGWYVADGRTVNINGTNEVLVDLTGNRGFLMLAGQIGDPELLTDIIQSTGAPSAVVTAEGASEHTHVFTTTPSANFNTNSDGEHGHTVNWEAKVNFSSDEQTVDVDSGSDPARYTNAGNADVWEYRNRFSGHVSVSTGGAGWANDHSHHNHTINASSRQFSTNTGHEHNFVGQDNITQPRHKEIYLVVYMGG